MFVVQEAMGLRTVLRAAECLRASRGVFFTSSYSTTTLSEATNEWDAARPFHDIPGPKPWPIVGNIWRFVPRLGDLAGLGLMEMGKKFYMDFGRIAILSGIPGRKPVVLVYDEDDIEKVWRNDGPWPIRRGLMSLEHYRYITRRQFYDGAHGLLTTQGEEWGKARSTVNPIMLQPRVAAKHIPSIADVTDDFIQRIYTVRDENGETPADFLNDFYKWSYESICKMVLDIRLNCFKNDSAPDSEHHKMIECVDNIFDCLFQLNMKVPVWRIISTPTWRRYVKNSDEMNKIVIKYVNATVERLKTSPADDDRHISVLELLLNRSPNSKAACVMAIDMIGAGVDTTANATALLWYHLALNPDKQKILQAEIDTVLSYKKEPITEENINNLKYLKACMKESMRVHPVTIGNFRCTVNDMVLQGYQIPKGTDVLMYNVSGMEECFPEGAKFIPERWLKGHPEYDQKPHPFTSLPFGFGPRICIGKRLAENQILTVTAKIMQNFTIEWHHGPMKVASAFINTCGSPLRFKMIDRN